MTTVPLSDDTRLELTPAGRDALTAARAARVATALATQPGWPWDDDSTGTIARTVIAAIDGR